MPSCRRATKKVLSMRLKGPTGSRWTVDGLTCRGYGNYGRTDGPRRDPEGVGSLFSRKAVAQWTAIPHTPIEDITNLSLIEDIASKYNDRAPQIAGRDGGKKLAVRAIPVVSPWKPETYDGIKMRTASDQLWDNRGRRQGLDDRIDLLFALLSILLLEICARFWMKWISRILTRGVQTCNNSCRPWLVTLMKYQY